MNSSSEQGGSSELMKRFRAKNTRPELIVRSFLFASGLRFRIHQNKLPGNPDIVLRKYNTVIFVNGCFWHGHKGCKISKIPAKNSEFWSTKIAHNQKRDAKNQRLLRKLGWKVLNVWECQLQANKRNSTLSRLIRLLGK